MTRISLVAEICDLDPDSTFHPMTWTRKRLLVLWLVVLESMTKWKWLQSKVEIREWLVTEPRDLITALGCRHWLPKSYVYRGEIIFVKSSLLSNFVNSTLIVECICSFDFVQTPYLWILNTTTDFRNSMQSNYYSLLSPIISAVVSILYHESSHNIFDTQIFKFAEPMLLSHKRYLLNGFMHGCGDILVPANGIMTAVEPCRSSLICDVAVDGIHQIENLNANEIQ